MKKNKGAVGVTSTSEYQPQKTFDEINELLSISDLDTLLHRICEKIPPLVNGKGCSVFLLPDHLTTGISQLINADGNIIHADSLNDKKSYIVLADTTREESKNKIGKAFYRKNFGLTGWIFKTGRPLNIKDMQDDDELQKISPDLEWKDAYGGAKVHFPNRGKMPFLGVPLIKGESVLGVIRVAETLEGGAFHNHSLDILKSFSAILSNLIDNVTSKKNLATSKENLEKSLNSLLKIGSTRDKQEVFEQIVRAVASLVKAESCELYTLDKYGEKIELRASTCQFMKNLRKKGLAKSYERGWGLTGWVFKTGKPLCLKELDKFKKGWVLTNEDLKLVSDGGEIDPEDRNVCWRDSDAHFEKDHPKHPYFLGVPVKAENDEVIGVLRVSSPQPNVPFSTNDKELLNSFSNNIALVLHNQRQGELSRVLIEIGNIYDNDNLFSYIVDQLPELVLGRGCSIFLTDANKVVLSYTNSSILKEVSFKEKEFSKHHSAENLGKTIRATCVDLPIQASAKPVKWLNELLKVSDLYERFQSAEQRKYSETAQLLLKERGEIPNPAYPLLSVEKQNTLQRLNRFVIEETFPEQCPLLRNKREVIELEYRYGEGKTGFVASLGRPIVMNYYGTGKQQKKRMKTDCKTYQRLKIPFHPLKNKEGKKVGIMRMTRGKDEKKLSVKEKKQFHELCKNQKIIKGGLAPHNDNCETREAGKDKYALSFLAVPIKSKTKEVLGVIRIPRTSKDGRFTEGDLALVESVAGRLTSALEIGNSVRILSEINKKINSPTGTEKIIMDEILTAITKSLGYEFATIQQVVEEEGIRYVKTVDVKKNPKIKNAVDPGKWVGISHLLNPPPGEKRDIHAYILEELGGAVVVKGWHEHFDKKIYKEHKHEDLVRAFVPIIAYESRAGVPILIGTLEAGHNIKRKDNIDDQELAVLCALADQIAIAKVNQRLLQNEEEAKAAVSKKLHMLSEINAKINSSAGHDNILDILDEILKAVTEKLGYEFAVIWLLDKGKEIIRQTAAHKNPLVSGAIDPSVCMDFHYPLTSPEGIAIDIRAQILQKKPPKAEFNNQECNGKQIVSALVPITAIVYETKNEKPIKIGILEAGYDIHRQEEIAPQELEMLQAVANQVAITIDNYNLIQASKINAAATFHSIKGKTTTIEREIGTLRAAMQNGKNTQAIMSNIEGCTSALNRIITKLVNISRVVILPREYIDFPGFIDKLLDTSALNQKGITINKDIHEGLPKVKIDPYWLGEALGEIFNNAAEYLKISVNKEHNIWIKINAVDPAQAENLPVRFKRTGILLQIEDNGPGIQEENKNCIWALGQTFRPGGNGIGLYVVARVVEDHSGMFYEDGSFGKGARFNIFLPMHD